MIIQGITSVGTEVLHRYPEDQLSSAVTEKLFQELRHEIIPMIEIEARSNEATNTTEYLGEIAVLSKKRFRELESMEEKYYKLLANNVRGGDVDV